MIRRAELTLDMVMDPGWLLWFKRHGFDPDIVLVAGWTRDDGAYLGYRPVAGWVECDDDARTVTTLLIDRARYSVVRVVQLESRALPFPELEPSSKLSPQRG